MPIVDAYAERKFQRVMKDTWGHLKATPGRHKGFIVLYWSGYGGDYGVLDSSFEGVEDSPWLYDHMLLYVEYLQDSKKIDQGHVWRFDGEYVLREKSFRFVGRVRQVDTTKTRRRART